MKNTNRDYLLELIKVKEDLTVISNCDFIKELLFDIKIKPSWSAKINITNSEDMFLQLNKVTTQEETLIIIEPILDLEGNLYEVSENLVLIDNYTYNTFYNWDLLKSINKKPIIFNLEDCE